MCGIAGIVSVTPINAAIVRRMIDPLRHRGPDDEGVWLDEQARIGLGHRRLAIVDLSASGHQPMSSHNGRYVLNFNGEIYNHAALRSEIEAGGGGPAAAQSAWRGHSDTETLIEAIALWGLPRALQKCAGMFALGLWDRQERTLRLARDRFGEKPLYYGWAGEDFVFASELKALSTHPGFDNAIDRNALHAFAARGYVPSPLSIYRSIRKLEPASILTLTFPGGGERGERENARITREPYWSYRETVEAGMSDPIAEPGRALIALEDALAEAIRGQSAADVPVGAFLSGGIDSSTVVAMYRKYGAGTVRTYSIGFEEPGFDEARHARAVAAYFGTEHHEFYVGARETRDMVPLLPSIYDEPFADPSQIPTALLSRMARQDIKVALSGDGGDELFGGYGRYVTAARSWTVLERLPARARRAAAAGLSRFMPNPHTKMQRTIWRIGHVNSLTALYTSFRDEWTGEGSPVLGADFEDAPPMLDLKVGSGAPAIVRMMYADAMSYLPDDILCKVDRAAMASSLETRVPFLDHRVAAVAARIPIKMNIRGGAGKQILKELLFSHAPRHLFDRPKAGFSVPVGAWIRGPLRPWAEDLLDRSRLSHEGYFDADRVRKRWREHLAGERDGTWSIWPILMFQAWKAA